MSSYHFHVFSPPTPFPSLYKNICRKWGNIHKSISYYPNQTLSVLVSKCHPALTWEHSQLPNTFEAWKREAAQAVRNSFLFKGINPPNLIHATFLSKIKLQMFKNQDYSCCKAWLRKKGSLTHISTNIFLYGLRPQSLNLGKATGIFTIWSLLLWESSPDHPSMSLISHRSHWTMVSLIPSHAMQHISCPREHSDNVSKHALEQHRQNISV